MNRRWRRLLRRPWVVEGVTLNDDFLNWASDVPAVIRTREPAWVSVQEAKRRRYRRLVRAYTNGRYDAVQRMTNDATRGVAVVWDTQQLRAVGSAVDDPTRLGWGYQQLVPAGYKIMARGVAWRDVEVLKRDRLKWLRRKPRPPRYVRLAAYHEVPPRVPSSRRDQQRDALAAWAAQSPIPIWLGTDANDKHPTALARRLNARWRGHHVDHHFITGRMRFRSKARPLKRRTSDHHPVTVLAAVPPHRS